MTMTLPWRSLRGRDQSARLGGEKKRQASQTSIYAGREGVIWGKHDDRRVGEIAKASGKARPSQKFGTSDGPPFGDPFVKCTVLI